MAVSLPPKSHGGETYKQYCNVLTLVALRKVKDVKHSGSSRLEIHIAYRAARAVLVSSCCPISDERNVLWRRELEEGNALGEEKDEEVAARTAKRTELSCLQSSP
jgi:hypothetical protein